LKTVDFEGAVCVEHDGGFVPATKAERKDTGTNKIVEEMSLPRA
jgi:hypothetical protein